MPLAQSGRYDEALILLREQNDLLSQCLEQDPANEEYRWEAANTLRNAGMIEIDFQRYDEALDYLDQATELVIGTDSDHPRRQHLISHLSHAYHQLGDLSDRNGHPDEAKHAKNGQLKIHSLVESDHSERPDRMLVKACVLADHGDWHPLAD